MTRLISFDDMYFVYVFVYLFIYLFIYFYSVGGAKTGDPPQEKTPGTPASRTWLVSHVPRAGLEPTPGTAVRWSDG